VPWDWSRLGGAGSGGVIEPAEQRPALTGGLRRKKAAAKGPFGLLSRRLE